VNLALEPSIDPNRPVEIDDPFEVNASTKIGEVFVFLGRMI
jgi:hypothetical protein